MEADSWLWFALIAFLVFCCVPMLFMGRRHTVPKRRDAAPGRDTTSPTE
jgi:hypothetical protein